MKKTCAYFKLLVETESWHFDTCHDTAQLQQQHARGSWTAVPLYFLSLPFSHFSLVNFGREKKLIMTAVGLLQVLLQALVDAAWQLRLEQRQDCQRQSLHSAGGQLHKHNCHRLSLFQQCLCLNALSVCQIKDSAQS